MKILIDTNVLFSALGFQGVSGQLLEELVRGNHTLVTSDYILEELKQKITMKFTGPQKERALTLLLFILSRMQMKVIKRPEYQENLEQTKGVVPEQDTPILAVALLRDVDFLVTGDNHFLKNQKVEALGVSVLSPSDMLGLINP